MADLSQQMASLSRQISQLETRLGELSGDIAELRLDMDPFLKRYRTEVLDHEEELVKVEREIADVKATLGDRDARSRRASNAAFDHLPENYVSVDEQYRRVWKGESPARPTGPRDLPPATLTLKKLYAEVIALIHPQLTHDPRERERRNVFLEGVNEAYIRRNQPALQAMLDAHKNRSNLPAVVDESVVKQLRDQIVDMEILIGELEGDHYELRYGEMAQAKAEVDKAALADRDLIAEMNATIKRNIAQAKQELADLRALL
jgi:TolA-binding protein